MPGQPFELRIRAGAGKNLRIAHRCQAPALALKRLGDDGRTTAPRAGIDDLVNEVDKLVWKTNSDLLAHPITVANRCQAAGVLEADHVSPMEAFGSAKTR